MSWERWTEAALLNGGFWLAHLNYVAFWVLASLGLLLLGLRLMLQRLALRRSGTGGRGWRNRAAWCGAAALVAAAMPAGYAAVRPDPTFYGTIAGSAFESGDCRRAVEYYSPLVDWGSRDLQAHVRLATCQLRLGRMEASLRTLMAARGLPGGDAPALRLLASRALQGLGRRTEAAGELALVIGATPPGPDRERLELELEQLSRGAGGPGR